MTRFEYFLFFETDRRECLMFTSTACLGLGLQFVLREQSRALGSEPRTHFFRHLTCSSNLRSIHKLNPTNPVSTVKLHWVLTTIAHHYVRGASVIRFQQRLRLCECHPTRSIFVFTIHCNKRLAAHLCASLILQLHIAPPCFTRKKCQELLLEHHPALACVKRRRYRFIFVNRSTAIALIVCHMCSEHRRQPSQLRCYGDFHNPPAVDLAQRHHACTYINSSVISIIAEHVVPNNHVSRAGVSAFEHPELQIKRTPLV